MKTFSSRTSASTSYNGNAFNTSGEGKEVGLVPRALEIVPTGEDEEQVRHDRCYNICSWVLKQKGKTVRLKLALDRFNLRYKLEGSAFLSKQQAALVRQTFRLAR